MVGHLKSMVDMRRTPEEKQEYATSLPSPASQPDYPYGLCISLCNDEIAKLNLDTDEVKPGDLIHFMAMAVVTSVSKNASQDQEPHERIELQITHMSAENEETEFNEEDEEEELDTENHPGRPDKYSRLYGDT